MITFTPLTPPQCWWQQCISDSQAVVASEESMWSTNVGAKNPPTKPLEDHGLHLGG